MTGIPMRRPFYTIRANGMGVLVDYYVGYTSDPNNPVTSVDLYVDLPPQFQTMSPALLRARLTKAKRLNPNGLVPRQRAIGVGKLFR